jgi:hypothetical protein
MSEWLGMGELDFSDPETYRRYFGTYPPGHNATTTPPAGGTVAGPGPTPQTGDSSNRPGTTTGPRITERYTNPPIPPDPPAPPKFNPATFSLTKVDPNHPNVQRAVQGGGTSRYFDLDATNTDLQRRYGAGEIDKDYFDAANKWLAPQLQSEGVKHYTGIGRQGVRNRLGSDFSNAGVDISPYSRDIEDELDFMEQGLPSGVDPRTIPSVGFGPGGASQIMDRLNRRYQGRAQSQLRSTLGDPYLSVSSNAADDIINRIIGEQRGEAEQGIDRQYRRGALNEFGRNDALSRLGAREKQVRARLQGRGASLLDTIRGRAQAAYDRAGEGVAASSITNPYDFTSAKNQYDNAIRSGMNDLEGSMRDLVSPDEFSLNELLGQSYSAQGPVNNTAPILAALETRNRIKSNKRGLGTVGAF